MAAANFKSVKASPPFPIPSYVGAGVLLAQHVTFTLPEVPEVGDTYDFFSLPAGAVPVGGYAAITDIDTGVETFDLDIGIAANDAGGAADPDYFANGGVWTGDAVVPPLTNGAEIRHFNGPFPVQPQLLGDTIVQGVVNAVANTGGTGTITVVVYFTLPFFANS